MKSLELLCFLKDFETKTHKKQKEFISGLLETEAGKDVIREMKLPNLLKKFKDANDLVKKCLTFSKKAQDQFAAEKWVDYLLYEFSITMNEWICFNTDCFVSEDEIFICLHNMEAIMAYKDYDDINEFTYTLEGNEIHFKRIRKFDLSTWIHGPNFESDRIFAFCMEEFVKDRKIHVWWDYFHPSDF